MPSVSLDKFAQTDPNTHTHLPTGSWKARPPTLVRKAVDLCRTTQFSPTIKRFRIISDPPSRLLAAATSFPTFSEEELSMVRYYAVEVQKILPVSAAK